MKDQIRIRGLRIYAGHARYTRKKRDWDRLFMWTRSWSAGCARRESGMSWTFLSITARCAERSKR